MSESGPSPAPTEQTIRSALWTLVTGDPSALELFTEDVTCSTPMVELAGRDQLQGQLSDRLGGLTDVDLHVDDIAVDVDGCAATVAWRFAADHAGAILVNEDVLYDGAGGLVGLSVTTRFTFRDGRICSFRHEYDVNELTRQLGGGRDR